jgi:hypothetical protein
MGADENDSLDSLGDDSVLSEDEKDDLAPSKTQVQQNVVSKSTELINQHSSLNLDPAWPTSCQSGNRDKLLSPLVSNR